MIKTLKLQLLAGLFLGTLILTGCKDECKDVTCVQGACVDGNCICDAGYYGTDCATAFNANLEGDYALTEVCDLSGNWNYTVTIAKKAGSATEATIEGFYQENNRSVTATISNNGASLTIPKQNLGDSGFQLEATAAPGSISNDGKTINLRYTVTQTNVLIESCTATLTR